MTIVEPTSGTTPWQQNALYAVVNGTGGTEITDQIDARICPIVGRFSRTTNSPGWNSTTKVRILQVNATVRNGRTYMIFGYGEVTGDTAGMISQSELRITTNGVDPVVTDTQIGRSLITTDAIGIPKACILMATFVATANATLKAMICTNRPLGSGSGVWECASDRPMFMNIADCGPTITPAGVAY